MEKCTGAIEGPRELKSKKDMIVASTPNSFQVKSLPYAERNASANAMKYAMPPKTPRGIPAISAYALVSTCSQPPVRLHGTAVAL